MYVCVYHIYIPLSLLLKAIPHKKELGLFKQTADLRTGTEKVRNEPETSPHAKK